MIRYHNLRMMALREPMNVFGMAGLFGLTWANGLHPVLAAMGVVAAEVAYLLFVPDTAWYRGMIEARRAKALREQRARLKRQVLPKLRSQDRQRFQRLEALRNQLPALTPGEYGSDIMRDVLTQMDVLLDKFLEFAAKDARYRQYLVEMVRPGAPTFNAATNWADRLMELANRLLAEPARSTATTAMVSSTRTSEVSDLVQQIQKALDAHIAELQAGLQTQTSDTNRQIVTKNIEVITKRRDRIGELGEIINNIDCQLDLIANSFALIADQVRVLPPEQVLQDIADVVQQTEVTTTMLAAAAPLDSQINRVTRVLK